VRLNPAAPQTRNIRPFSKNSLRPSPVGSNGHLGSKICDLPGSWSLSCLLSLSRFSFCLLSRVTRTKTDNTTISTAATVCPYWIPASLYAKWVSHHTALKAKSPHHTTAMTINTT
jgi:hypothetical protein